MVGIHKKAVTAWAQLVKAAQDGSLETGGSEAGQKFLVDVPAAGLVVPVKAGAFGNIEGPEQNMFLLTKPDDLILISTCFFIYRLQ